MPLSLNKRRHLSLSQQELCAISESIGRDYAPRFSRHGRARSRSAHFSSRELLDISQQISRDFAPMRQSDESQVVLMSVSPRRLHVYWQIAKQKLQQALQTTENPTPETFALRIYGEVQGPAETDEAAHLAGAKHGDAQQNQTATISVDQARQRLMTASGVSHEGLHIAVAELERHARSSVLDTASPWIELVIETSQGQRDIVLPEASPGIEPIRYNAVLGHMGAARDFKPLVHSNVTMAQAASRALADSALAPSIERFIMAHPAPSSARAASAQGNQSS